MRILIAYYSWSGNTRRVAELIQEETDGDLFEIKPAAPYTSNYGDVVKQARKEIQEGYKPSLQNLPENMADYEMVFVGTPNWCSTIAPPVAAFLAGVNLKGKAVVPFCTHGGGGLASCGRDIAKLSSDAEILESLIVYGSNSNVSDVSAWLNKIKGSKNG